jgi:hypothetical protein
MLTFTGADGVKTYRATVIKHAIAFYVKTGMKINKAYTPTNMLRAAGEITGKTYKRGQYQKAMSDLGAWLANFGTSGND